MGSRPWRRTGVPPMPALIPIAALRNKNTSTVGGGGAGGVSGAAPVPGHVCAQSQCPQSDNNNGQAECEPCERVQRRRSVASGGTDTARQSPANRRHTAARDTGPEEPEPPPAVAVAATEFGSEYEDEVSCGAGDDVVGCSSGAANSAGTCGGTVTSVEGEQTAEVMDERGVARGRRRHGTERHERSRRPPQQPSAAVVAAAARRRRSAIDETSSRDRDGAEQAPARRPRPERHRKSDRRRREHRSDRLLRKRSTSGSSANTTITTSASAADSGPGDSASPNRTGQPPRVNPIFVWIRQEDTRIVDVRCEDYDKRNRILLTKTAHGWRAIPRTETLATTLEEVPASALATARHHHEHRHERSKNGPGRPRRKKSRLKQSRHEQHEGDQAATAAAEPATSEAVDLSPPSQSPAWDRMSADIESHLPSHTITVPNRNRTTTSSSARSTTPEIGEVPSDDSLPAEVREAEDIDDIEEVAVDSVSVNSAVAQAPLCRATNDASPLDNLLAVAELEFNHQVRCASSSPLHEEVDGQERQSKQSLTVTASEAAECVYVDSSKDELSLTDSVVIGQTEDCDYNEDEDEDENHFSDVLDRLEQSLQSPIEIDDQEDEEQDEEDVASIVLEEDGITQEEADVDEGQYDQEQANVEQEVLITELHMQLEKEQEQPEAEDEDLEEEEEEDEFYDGLTEKAPTIDAQKDACEQPTDLRVTNVIEEDLLPTDLSTHSKKRDTIEDHHQVVILDDMMPTDLSIRKHSSPALTIEPIIRPPSQNSETIQSPQPSGIPAVPPSPDIYPISKQTSTKSVFLESLLSASPKLSLNPELTITRNQKEPLDLGKGRKSASPTVTCSEEAKNVGEPTPKKLKMEDITLKNLLHAEGKKPEIIIKPIPSEKKQPSNMENSRLLELLTSDTVPDAMTQLKQLLADPHINIPDPMLIPKDRLSHIMVAPAKEIPRLLVSRPELRYNDACTQKYIMRDPDLIAISIEQIKAIIEKNVPIPLAEVELTKILKMRDTQKQPAPEKPKKTEMNKHHETKSTKNNVSSGNQSTVSNDYHRYSLQHQQQLMLQEVHLQQLKHHQNQLLRKGNLANDIDAATTATFNQMMWLPYLSQLEANAAAAGNSQDFLKMLNSVLPAGGYPPQHPEHVPPMYSTARFGVPNAYAVQPPIDYNPSALELAMWQEAMLRQKNTAQDNLTLTKHSNAYKEREAEKRNYQSMLASKNKLNQTHQVSSNLEHHLLNGQKHLKNGHYNAEQHYLNSVQQQLLNGQLHTNNMQQHLINSHYSNSSHYLNGHHSNNSQQYVNNSHHNNVSNNITQEKYRESHKTSHYSSSRTSSHNAEQKNSTAQNMGPPLLSGLRTNLQIPHYNSILSQAASQKPSVPKSTAKEESANKIFKYGNPFFTAKQKQELQQLEKQHMQIEKQLQAEKQQEQLRLPPPRIPRLSQNLPPCPGKDLAANPQSIRTPGEPHKPIDLSDSKKKFKESPVLDTGLFRKYPSRDDAEVGSTTEEMNTGGHESQTHHVWNPLFGK